MSIIWCKRYRMEFDLRRPVPDVDLTSTRYRLLPWDGKLLEWHAQAKYESFREELDASVFSCLGNLPGCLRLMNDISKRDTFVPESTWLAVHNASPTDERLVPCGTIQGLIVDGRDGSIQNVGVVPGHRGKGVARAMLSRALKGFRQVGLDRAALEVTAQNDDAIRVYSRFGFRIARVVFKPVEYGPDPAGT